MSTEARETLALHPDWLDGGEITAAPLPFETLTNGNVSVSGSYISGGNVVDYGQWTYPIATSGYVYYT